MRRQLRVGNELEKKIIPFTPWMDNECFGEIPSLSKKPETGYGYIYGEKIRSHLTQDGLMSEISNDRNQKIQLCWTPEHTYLVVPEEISTLYQSLLERRKLAIKNPAILFLSIFSILVFGGVLWWGLSNIFRTGIDELLANPGKYAGLQYLVLMLFLFGVFPLVQRWWSLRQLNGYTPAKLRKEIPDSRYSAWLARNKSPWTIALLICIGFIGLFQFLFGVDDSIIAAGLVKDMVRSGEWWRLLTAPFLHVTLWHIYMNAVVLYGLGRIVEITTNRAYLLLVFVVSAFGGSLFSLILLPEKSSVGASGGIMGLLGFLIAFGYAYKDVFPKAYLMSLLHNVLFIALIGLIGFGFIDNAAHLGGFLMGIALGLALSRDIGSIPKPSSLLLNIVTVIMSLLVLYFAGIAVVQIVGNTL